jgi:hypothetical protein
MKPDAISELCAALVRPRACCTRMLDEEIEGIAALTARHGLMNVARAAGCSPQSVAKAIGRQALFESTKRRLRSVLRQP